MIITMKSLNPLVFTQALKKQPIYWECINTTNIAFVHSHVFLQITQLVNNYLFCYFAQERWQGSRQEKGPWKEEEVQD